MNVNNSRFTAVVLSISRKSGYLVALLLLAMFATLLPARAEAQTSDTWKSVAIIGGTTAAGAYIGHKVAGRTGAYVGAGVGAATGYAIDRRRRQNQYNNGYYGNNGYYDNSGYYGNDPYGNGGYYPAPANSYPYPYPNGYQQNNSYSTRR